MRWTLPTILTVLRLAAAPLVAVAFLVLPRPLADWVGFVLFVGAAATDWIDGYLARRLGQISRFGTMLDPIADKAMVLTALLVLVAFSSQSLWLLLPASLIVFREVFVSGLREFLGADAGRLQVTGLAKWKTTVQMVAISVLFLRGILFHAMIGRMVGMDPATAEGILAGDVVDEIGLRSMSVAADMAGWLGTALLWLAAVLTLVTGWDYFRKAMPYLREAG